MDHYLKRIEDEIKTRSTDELNQIKNKLKMYSVNLYMNNDCTGTYERVEYVMAKIEDEIIIRRVKETVF